MSDPSNVEEERKAAEQVADKQRSDVRSELSAKEDLLADDGCVSILLDAGSNDRPSHTDPDKVDCEHRNKGTEYYGLLWEQILEPLTI